MYRKSAGDPVFLVEAIRAGCSWGLHDWEDGWEAGREGMRRKTEQLQSVKYWMRLEIRDFQLGF
jgi:hypothetical protein